MELRKSTTALAARLCGRVVVGCFLMLLSSSAFAQSICAEVKIQIDQKVSLERQAFEAVLKIRNGLDGISVENVDVNVTFKDEQGNPVIASSDPDNQSAAFFIRQDLLVGIDNVDGNGTVPGNTNAEAHWLIIPAKDSGGELSVGKRYQVGATVTYKIAGEAKTVDVIPETITVLPQPVLRLEYFLPGNVYADDALTPEQEPVVPFTLGVRITNVGHGPASHVKIESAQPHIQEEHNPQGALIDFHIDGSYVGDAPSQPSLLIDFGSLAAGESRIGRWIMTTSLSGQFFDFEAEYTHADALGGALTSLIEDGGVKTYLLTHDVIVDINGRDTIRDFLAQPANATQDDDTYWIYESSGAPPAEVPHDFHPTWQGMTLSFPPAGALTYARAVIGLDGQTHTVSATRLQDNKPVPAANVWFSKKRDEFGNGWRYYLNLFEADPTACNGQCSYAIVYDGVAPQASIAGLVYDDLNANGIQDSGESGMAGVALTLNAGGSPLTTNSTVDGSFHFDNLAAGTYSLSVGAVANHTDGVVVAGSAGGSPSAGMVSSIVLQASTHATGYVFAKVPSQQGTFTSDLAIDSLTTSTTTPRVGDTFDVVLHVSNHGPDPTDASATITLPSGLEVVSANASTGTFDAGVWSIGGVSQLGSGASLTLQVRASVVQSLDLSAAISVAQGGTASDPEPGNNVANLTVQVQALPAVHVEAGLLRETRVLALAGCVLWSTTDADACASARKTALDGYLGSHGVDHFTTTDQVEFLKELRSGHWNTYWIAGSRHYSPALGDALLAELGAAIYRGDSLLLDGATIPVSESESRTLDEWAGVSFVQKTSVTETLTIQPNPYLDYADVSVGTVNSVYEATDGTVLATYSDDAPAIVLGSHNNGRVWFFNFDLLGVLAADASRDALFAQIATAMRPELPESFTADAYVPVVLTVKNDGPALTIAETVDVSAGTTLLEANPTPSTTSGNEVSWIHGLAASGEFNPVVALRSAIGGDPEVDVQVTEQGAPANILATGSTTFSVEATRDVIRAANSLPLLQIGNPDEGAITAASTALAAAEEARGGGFLGEAINQMLAADASLAGVSDPELVADNRLALAKALQAVGREWYVSMSTCDPSGVSVVRDSGSTFVALDEAGGSFMDSSPGSDRTNWDLGWPGGDTASGRANLAGHQTYTWILSYFSGSASLTVADAENNLLIDLLYTANVDDGGSIPIPGYPPLEVGNAIGISIGAGNQFASVPWVTWPLIEIHATELNGVPLTDSISTEDSVGGNLYYYNEAMRTNQSFTLSGTIQKSDAADGDFVSFYVNAGNVDCKRSGR